MASTFLNTEVECESKVTLILNFSADLDTNINQDSHGLIQKKFVIDKNKIYNISYIERFPDHVSDIKKISGRITGISYTDKKANFVNPVIYRSVDKRAPLKLDERLQPSTFTVDCSTEYKHDVRLINIGDIRDFELKDNLIDLNAYTLGDTLRVDMFDGTQYDMCVVKDFYFGDDFQALMVDWIIPVEKQHADDDPIAEVKKIMLKKDDIKFITLIRGVADFQYGLGDTIEITVKGTEQDTYEAYPGTIMDVVTLDNSDRTTVANLVAILLKYRMTVGDQVKSVTRLFHMNEIERILPFEFPNTIIEEQGTTSDDPDDIENDMYGGDEVVVTPYQEGEQPEENGEPDQQTTDPNTPTDTGTAEVITTPIAEDNF